MSIFGPQPLAPAGSTGNNTHQSVSAALQNALLCVLMVVEAVGATPTLTYVIQGTLDPPTTPDGSANWFPIPVVQTGNDTPTATPAAVTAVGAYPNWVSLAGNVRFVRRLRVVTSLNTNVTYRSELHSQFTY